VLPPRFAGLPVTAPLSARRLARRRSSGPILRHHGWLFRDLQDAPLSQPRRSCCAFRASRNLNGRRFTRFAFVDDSFFTIVELSRHQLPRRHSRTENLGLELRRIETGWWADAVGYLCAPSGLEAAQIHAGNFDQFAPPFAIASSGAPAQIPRSLALRQRLEASRAYRRILAAHELVLLPSIPVARLAAGADHSQTRMRLSGYTAPFSLAGTPTVRHSMRTRRHATGRGRGNAEPLLHSPRRSARTAGHR